MEDMFNNVNHLIECQRFVKQRVQFLEEKRVELTQITQNLGVSSYKETLEKQIKTMEMKLSIKGVTDQNEEKAVITDNSLENKNRTKNVDIMIGDSAKVSWTVFTIIQTQFVTNFP